MFVHGCMCHMGAAVQLHMGLMDDRGVLSRVAVAGWRWLLQAAMWSPLQPPSFLHAPTRMCTPALRAVGFPACAAFYIVMAVLNTVKSASQTAEHVCACVCVCSCAFFTAWWSSRQPPSPAADQQPANGQSPAYPSCTLTQSRPCRQLGAQLPSAQYAPRSWWWEIRCSSCHASTAIMWTASSHGYRRCVGRDVHN